MNWLEKQTDKGILKYRMPNVAEGYNFLSLAEKMGTTQDFLKAKGKIVENLEELVSYKELGYESWQECIGDIRVMFRPLSDIAQEIIDELNEVLLKKN